VTKLLAERKTPETEDTPLRNHHRDNSADPSNSDAQYLKSIKIDVLPLMDVTTHIFS